MELVYLRNCTHNNLEASGFYFSKNYHLIFDDITLINYTKTNHQNIFGNNLIITAIAGENGSGKSSLLNYIYEFSNKNYYPYEKPTANTHSGSDFMIYKKDELCIKGDRYGIFDRDYKFQSNNDSVNCVLIDYDNKVISRDSYSEYSTLFKIISVLSKKDDILKYFDEKFIFKKFQLNIIREELKYFDEKKHPYSNFFLNLKEKITTLIKSKILPITASTTFPQINNELMYTTKNIELEIKISFLIKYINYLQERFISQSTSNEDFLNEEENFFQDLDFENMFKKILKFDAKINASNIFSSDLNEEVSVFLFFIEKLKNESDINMQSRYFYDKYNVIEYETSKTFNIKEDYILIQEIINKIESIKYSEFFKCFSFELLSYDSNVIFTELSSGEQNLINKYMLILYEVLFHNIELILLDEPDVLLHPNWAKKFIKKLVQIITQDSILKEKQLHIIMSTHSPFILSDLPKENIIFLKNGKQVNPDITQTFGANIHTLLSDGFFMSNGLMGEFAKSKIEEIKKFYELIQKLQNKGKIKKELWKKSYEKRKTRFGNIQKIIGEPFLQTIIKNYLDELEILFNGKKEFLDKEIKRLEELRKELK
ncbi:AAA family ATPase [Aliarcobacter butzleri]|nr:AAA family ATPase [Aliarcobacter butzleri]